MSELGETSDPRALVPGAPEAVYDLAAGLRWYGAALEEAGENLRRISSGDWTGAAAAGFQDRFAVKPARWLRAADAFTASAGEVDRYADVLAWAQAQAREAIARYQQGEQVSAAAQAAHRGAVERAEAHNAVNAAVGSTALVTVAPFVDPGEEHRAAARDMLARARAQLAEAGAQAAAVVARERDAAPEEPSWLSEVGSFLGEVGKGAWESTLGLVQFAAETHPARLVFDPDGYWEAVTTRAQGALYAVQHPVEFGKAVLDWDTWKANPGRAIGHLVPDAVLAAATAAPAPQPSAAPGPPGPPTTCPGPRQCQSGPSMNSSPTTAPPSAARPRAQEVPRPRSANAGGAGWAVRTDETRWNRGDSAGIQRNHV